VRTRFRGSVHVGRRRAQRRLELGGSRVLTRFGPTASRWHPAWPAGFVDDHGRAPILCSPGRPKAACYPAVVDPRFPAEASVHGRNGPPLRDAMNQALVFGGRGPRAKVDRGRSDRRQPVVGPVGKLHLRLALDVRISRIVGAQSVRGSRVGGGDVGGDAGWGSGNGATAGNAARPARLTRALTRGGNCEIIFLRERVSEPGLTALGRGPIRGRRGDSQSDRIGSVRPGFGTLLENRGCGRSVAGDSRVGVDSRACNSCSGDIQRVRVEGMKLEA